MRDTILVCGSREWTDMGTMRYMLETIADLRPRLVHGGARGADMTADIVWRQFMTEGYDELSVQSYPVDNDLDGAWPAAGVRRNERMLKTERDRIHHAYAFTCPGPKLGMTCGTADMVERLIKAGVRVAIVPAGGGV